jgi:hypothetical protein
MNNDWNTVYREACLASESAQLLSDAYINAEAGSYEEDLLDRIRERLYDRFDVDIAFCYVITSQKSEQIAMDSSNFDDVPF